MASYLAKLAGLELLFAMMFYLSSAYPCSHITAIILRRTLEVFDARL